MNLHESENVLVAETLIRATPFSASSELEPLIERIANSRVVMLGESSHGTHEFYEWRKVISQELITKHGFRFIAVEGDWPACFKLNEFVHGIGDEKARDALRHFERWPTWMWANREVMELAIWMCAYNSGVKKEEQIGFYGLDVYSLFESIDAAIKQLDHISPFLARRMKARFACFDPFQRDEIAYAKSLHSFPAGCLEEVSKNLKELLALRVDMKPSSGTLPFEDPFFDAEQNARIVANAENYYRTMVHGNDDSWNVRDRHMAETLTNLLNRHGKDSKAIVWAHNTHIGDYRATDMERMGQINIGGLAREEFGEKNVSLVGFGTYSGEVIASTAWDGPTLKMKVPRGKPGSYEAAFHLVSKSLNSNSFFLDFRDAEGRAGALSHVRGHRAIGVVYRAEHESFGNYVPTSLSKRYDAFLFFDQTNALEPLKQRFDAHEFPETWPQGM